MRFIASAISALEEYKTLQDAPSLLKSQIIGEWLVDAPEDLGEFMDGISKQTIRMITTAMADGQTSDVGLIFAVALANTPKASDVLAHIESRARDAMIEPGSTAENEIESDDRHNRNMAIAAGIVR